jgi:thiol-disulfide isomerase/thioredoxin
MIVLPSLLFILGICSGFDFSTSKVPSTTDDTFATLIPNQSCVILEFYSPCCPHCVNLAPTYEEVYLEVSSKRQDILVYKYDGSKNSAKSSLYGIRGFPTITLFLPGNVTNYQESYSGDRTKEKIIEWIYAKCPAAPIKKEEEKVTEKSASLPVNSSIPEITHHLLQFTSAFGEDIVKLISEYHTMKEEIATIGKKLDNYSSAVAESGLSVFSILVFIAIGAIIGYIIGMRSAVQNKQKVPL